jgi:hypothetical protein
VSLHTAEHDLSTTSARLHSLPSSLESLLLT